MSSSSFLLWLSKIDRYDENIVGEKAVDLGVMRRAELCIPDGFVVTLPAYSLFLRENKLQVKIQQLLTTISYEHFDSVEQVSGHIRRMILKTEVPEEIIRDISLAYRKLSGVFKDSKVLVSPSLLEHGSLAGIQEQTREVKGENNLVMKVREVWASLFEPQFMQYRHEHVLDHLAVGMAVIVQKVIVAEKSGTMLTMHNKVHDKSKIIIHDTKDGYYELDKHTMEILHSSKESLMSKDEVIRLGELGKKIEKYFYFPQEVLWAIEKGKIYILQTRELSFLAKPTEMLRLFLAGEGVSPGIRSGVVKVIHSDNDLGSFVHGDVLVAKNTKHEYLFAVRKAVAIITDEGGNSSYTRTISRDLGIPAVVETNSATKLLRSGTIVTVNGTTGEVYKGAVHLRPKENRKDEEIRTATKVLASIEGDYSIDRVSGLQADGIGILSAEALLRKLGENRNSENLAKQIAGCCELLQGFPVVYKASDFGITNLPGYLYDRDLFSMEIEALSLAREQYKVKNLSLMLPLVRTTKELIEIKHFLSSKRLHRSATFQLWVQISTPTNVLLLDKFIEVGLDGVSIDLMVLSMLLLGVDWMNIDLVSAYEHLYSSVVLSVNSVIKTAHKHSVFSTIHAQSPIAPMFLEEMVSSGISGVTVPPENVREMREKISFIERKLLTRKRN